MIIQGRIALSTPKRLLSCSAVPAKGVAKGFFAPQFWRINRSYIDELTELAVIGVPLTRQFPEFRPSIRADFPRRGRRLARGGADLPKRNCPNHEADLPGRRRRAKIVGRPHGHRGRPFGSFHM